LVECQTSEKQFNGWFFNYISPIISLFLHCVFPVGDELISAPDFLCLARLVNAQSKKLRPIKETAAKKMIEKDFTCGFSFTFLAHENVLHRR
jgi:hypothetical protein